MCTTVVFNRGVKVPLARASVSIDPVFNPRTNVVGFEKFQVIAKFIAGC